MVQKLWICVISSLIGPKTLDLSRDRTTFGSKTLDSPVNRTLIGPKKNSGFVLTEVWLVQKHWICQETEQCLVQKLLMILKQIVWLFWRTLILFFLCYNLIKGPVDVISNYLRYEKWYARFITLPFNLYLSDYRVSQKNMGIQWRIRYRLCYELAL